MFTNSRLATSAAWLPLALLVAAGCKQGPSPEVQARIDSLSQASSEKERSMQEVAENTRLVSEISKELATVAVPKNRYITARVKELEPKLQQSEQRVRELSTLSDSLKDALASTIQNLQGVIDNQKETIAGLTDQVEKLSAENVALKDTIDNMATEANTVYYIVGTKDELEQRGIVKEEGGARFLFVLWKSGKTLVPARNLDPTAFTPVDRRALSEIPLPAGDKEYHIVSRQDATALATPPSADGTITGRVKIADSARFWANSKYLIIVEG